jgi:hypothetical protein
MVFVFNDFPGMHTVATSTAGLADETATGGTQCEASGGAVMPCGLDHVSAANMVATKAHAAAYWGHLAAAAGHQQNYSGSIAGSATAYSQTELANTATVAGSGIPTAQAAAGLTATRL